MKIDFSGQSVLVTGASRGIGEQIAKDLRECGAQLILASRQNYSARDVADRFGDGAIHLQVDFLNPESTRTFLTQLKRFDRIDACINNAGLSRHKLLLDSSEQDWDETLAADLKAPYLITQVVAEIMKRRRYGRIVNITSVWAHQSAPEKGAYTAAKFGLRGLTVNSAVELAKDNILVNSVAPGPIMTDMLRNNYTDEQRAVFAKKLPIGRLGETHEVSAAVLFLASPLNGFITGQSLPVDGGFTIA